MGAKRHPDSLQRDIPNQLNTEHGYSLAERWEAKYRLLCEFWEEHHRWPKQGEQYHGVNLGDWCCTQRKRAKVTGYPVERRQKLQEIGFCIETPNRNATWNKMHDLLCEFHAKYNRWPKTNEQYQGENLGSWCAAQRQRARDPHYPFERRQKLEDIGFPLNSFCVVWDRLYTLLCEYYNEYQRWPKTGEQYQGENLGSWCVTQRHQAKNPSYPTARRRKLEELGFQFESRNGWDSMYAKLQKFFAEHQRFPKRKEKYMGTNLGLWYIVQLQKAKEPSYPADRRQKLLNIGFRLDTKDYDATWDQKYALLCEFWEEYHRWPKHGEQYKGENLGVWCHTQRIAAKEESYPAGRRQKMETIGFLAPVMDITDDNTDESR